MMKNFRLFLSKTLLVLVFAMPLCTMAQKNQKVAYIEETKILEAISGYETALKTIDSLRQDFNDELKEKKQNLNDKLQVLLSDYEITAEDTTESLEAKLNEEDKEKYALYKNEGELINQYSKNYKTTLEKKYNELVRPLLDRVDSIIAKYAEDNKIVVVYKYESLNVAYLNESLDITEAIIEVMKKD